MSRSAEQITLDEKIARIRKQNEEIIRRKKIIDEEIKSAKLTNAIVNTKKTYDDEVDDEPSLYSDSLVIHQKTTVVYPKIGTDRRQQSKQDDMIWRREREEIDNERIRRQKAASGWRREWDANKSFEVQTKPGVKKNQRDSVFQFQGGRSSENDYPDEKGGRPRADADQNRGVKVDLIQRLQSKRSFSDDGPDSTVGEGGQEPSFKDRNYNVRAVANAKLHVRSDRGPSGISREEKDVRKTLSGDEENIPTGSGSGSTNCWRTSGPLNLRKTISINHDNVPNVVLTKVTKYSETQTQTLPKYIPWKNDYSNREYDDDDDDIAVNLSKRLKNIVIYVNSDDKEEVQRVVELVPAKKADGTGTEKNATEQTSLQKVTPNVTLLPMNQDVSSAKGFESAVNSSGSTRQSKKVTFNNVGQSLPSGTRTTQGVVDDDDDDDEWEDVSDEDWEDVSD